MAASTNFTVADLLVGFEISDGMRVTVLTLGWLACVNGVFGNVLIITTLLSQQALRSMHNIYIANLALADLLVVGYVMVFFLLDLKLGYQPVASQEHCHFNAFLLGTCYVESVYTLVLISLNRYMGVCWNSLFVRIYTKKTIILSCIVTWIFVAFTCSFPFVNIGDTKYIYAKHTHICTFDPFSRVYTIMTVINIFVSTTLIGFFSLSILRFWKRSKTRIGVWSQTQNGPSQSRPAISSSDISLIRSLLLVFGLLVVLNLPLGAALAADFMFRLGNISPDVYVFLLLLSFINNSINWIIYGLMNKNFLRGYKRLMVLCRNKVSSGRPEPTHQNTQTTAM